MLIEEEGSKNLSGFDRGDLAKKTAKLGAGSWFLFLPAK
jgi:hypothetical protein